MVDVWDAMEFYRHWTLERKGHKSYPMDPSRNTAYFPSVPPVPQQLAMAASDGEDERLAKNGDLDGFRQRVMAATLERQVIRYLRFLGFMP